MQRMGCEVGSVIDVNPAKQGKYLPLTGIKVQSPEYTLAHMPTRSDIYVMNSNYLEEIRNATNNKFNYIGVDQ